METDIMNTRVKQLVIKLNQRMNNSIADFLDKERHILKTINELFNVLVSGHISSLINSIEPLANTPESKKIIDEFIIRILNAIKSPQDNVTKIIKMFEVKTHDVH